MEARKKQGDVPGIPASPTAKQQAALRLTLRCGRSRFVCTISFFSSEINDDGQDVPACCGLREARASFVCGSMTYSPASLGTASTCISVPPRSGYQPCIITGRPHLFLDHLYDQSSLTPRQATSNSSSVSSTWKQQSLPFHLNQFTFFLESQITSYKISNHVDYTEPQELHSSWQASSRRPITTGPGDYTCLERTRTTAPR